MAVAVICKLEHGKDLLDLNTGRYCLDDGDFMPPTTARAVTYGALLAGAEVVRKRRENRSWSFTVTITASSKSEAERAMRNLQSFLNRAGGHTPLFVLYRNFNDYDFEPRFGQFGAFSRYEVVHASAEISQDYNAALAYSNHIVRVRVNLTIKPQAVGLRQHTGQAKGFVFEDYIGKADGSVRGTHIGQAATNNFTNPRFMNATWNSGWTATGTGFITSENKDPSFILFGDTSARCSKSSTAASDRFTQSITLSAVTQYFSCYAKRIDSGAISDLAIWYGSSQTTTATAVGDGWYRLTASATGDGGAAEAGITCTGTQKTPFFVDGFQVTTTKHYEFMNGDWLGNSWASTKNGSAETAAVSYLRYDFDEILDNRTGWTMRVAWLPPVGTSGVRFFAEDDGDDIQLYIDGSNQIVAQVSTGNSVTSTGITITAGTPMIIHATYDGSTLTSYHNGTQKGTGSSKIAAATEPTWLYVGSDNAPAQHCGGTILGFATFDRAMSANQVLADYTQAIQQVTDGDRLDPLPWCYTEDGDNVIDNNNDGTLYNYAVIGGLMGDDCDVEYKMTSSQNLSLAKGITFGSLPVPQIIFDKDILTDGGTNTLLFENGTGTADTTANGEAVKRISLSTTSTTLLATAISRAGANILQEIDNVTGYFVAKDNATKTNVMVRMAIDMAGSGGGNESFVSDWRTLSTDTTLRPYTTFELPLDFEDYILDSSRIMGFRIDVKRATGSTTANFDVSHAIWLTNYSGVYADTVNSNIDSVYGRGRVLELVNSTTPTQTRGRRLFNRPLVIKPERLNVVMVQHTYDCFSSGKSLWSHGNNYNLTVNQFAVTPYFDIY